MNKTTLLRQYDRCYSENGWFAAVRNVIADVNVEQAAWKPVDAVNCIWESLSHIAYYNNAYLQRFKGVDYEYDVENNDQTFSVGEYDEAAWQADIAYFNAVMQEWRELISSADESKFDQPVSSKNPITWAELISDVNAHNAYHGGQIVLLRKMQGIWDETSGVT
mgnify:CR=1 FL=1